MKSKILSVISSFFKKEEKANNYTTIPDVITIPANIATTVKLLVIADTHGCLKCEDIPSEAVDACILLGDLTPRDIDIVKQAVDAQIYGVLGNHNAFDTYQKRGIPNIHGKVIEINGLRIAGLQGCCRYKNLNAPLYTDEESIQIANTLAPADVLISHDGPKGFHGCEDLAHSGLQGITDYCKNNNVQLNIHGHYHRNLWGKIENTLVACCYGVNVIKITTVKK